MEVKEVRDIVDALFYLNDFRTFLRYNYYFTAHPVIGLFVYNIDVKFLFRRIMVEGLTLGLGLKRLALTCNCFFCIS